MPKVKLTRQVTDGNVVSKPGDSVEVSAELASHYRESGWVEGSAPSATSTAPEPVLVRRPTRKSRK